MFSTLRQSPWKPRLQFIKCKCGPTRQPPSRRAEEPRRRDHPWSHARLPPPQPRVHALPRSLSKQTSEGEPEGCMSGDALHTRSQQLRGLTHSESVTILSTHPPRDTFAYAHACKATVVPSTLVRHPLEETAPWTGMDPGAVVGTDFKGRAALEIEAKEEWV